MDAAVSPVRWPRIYGAHSLLLDTCHSLARLALDWDAYFGAGDAYHCSHRVVGRSGHRRTLRAGSIRPPPAESSRVVGSLLLEHPSARYYRILTFIPSPFPLLSLPPRKKEKEKEASSRAVRAGRVTASPTAAAILGKLRKREEGREMSGVTEEQAATAAAALAQPT